MTKAKETVKHYNIRKWVSTLLILCVPITCILWGAHSPATAISGVLLMLMVAVYLLVIYDMVMRGKIRAMGAKKRRQHLFPFLYGK